MEGTLRAISRHNYRKDIANGRKPDISKAGTTLKIDGLHNIIFLIMIVAAVILSGTLPNLAAFQDAAGNVRGIRVFREVTLGFPSIIEVAIILLAALLSFKTTDSHYISFQHTFQTAFFRFEFRMLRQITYDHMVSSRNSSLIRLLFPHDHP